MNNFLTKVTDFCTTSQCTCVACQIKSDEASQTTCHLRRRTSGTETSQNTRYLRHVGSERSRATSCDRLEKNRHVGIERSRATSCDRLEEKQQLQDLNDRFASYIDRVRYLEGENSRLVTQVKLSQESVSQGVAKIKSMYESELNDARRLLDEMSKEKARLQLDAEQFKAGMNEWQNKYYRLNNGGQCAEKTIMELEARISDLQGRYTDIESQKAHYEKKYSIASTELQALEGQLDQAKKQLQSETLLRVDLENKCQTLKEELIFKSQVFEQELNATRSSTTIQVDQVDAGMRVDYEAKLQDALRRMRAEQEDAIRATRVEVEAMYERKVADLQTALHRARDSGVEIQDSMMTSRRQLSDLSTEVSTLRAQISQYESRIADLESQLKLEQDGFFSRIADKDSQIAELRQSLDEQMKEFSHLMDIKIRLDTEIAAYRQLLESEEYRLNMSNSVNVKETVSSALQHSSDHCFANGPQVHTGSISDSARKSRFVSWGIPSKTVMSSGLKRKHVEFGDSTRKLIQQGTSGDYLHASCGIQISQVDTNGQFIKLRNNSNKDISLDNWQLQQVANGQETAFKFPRGVILKGGQFTTVWSFGSGKIYGCRPSSFVMKERWIVGDRMKTTLYNNDGDEVASRDTRTSQTDSAATYKNVKRC